MKCITGHHSVTQHNKIEQSVTQQNKIEQSVVPTTHDNYHQDRSTMLTLHNIEGRLTDGNRKDSITETE